MTAIVCDGDRCIICESKRPAPFQGKPGEWTFTEIQGRGLAGPFCSDGHRAEFEEMAAEARLKLVFGSSRIAEYLLKEVDRGALRPDSPEFYGAWDDGS